MLVEHRVLGRVHAADLRTVRTAFGRIARTGAGDKDDLLRDFPIRRAADFAHRGTGSRGQTLELQSGDHVLVLPVAVFGEPVRGGHVKSGGDHHGTDLLGEDLVRLVESDRAGGTGLFTEFALARAVVHAMFPVDHRLVGHRLGERDVDRGTEPHGSVELAGYLLGGAFGGAGSAAGALLQIDAAGLQADTGLEIADKAFQRFDFGIGIEGDVGMLRHLDHAGGEDALRAVQRREGLGQLRHVPSDGGFALHQDDFMTGIGDVQGGLYPGDAAADHQRFFGDRYFDGTQGLVAADFLHLHPHQFDGFLGSGFAFLMHPGALFADVGDLAQVWVQARFGAGLAECRLVHTGTASGYHHPVESFFTDGVLDQGLPGIRTHVLVVHAHFHPVHLGDLGRHFFAIDRRADILAAMAYENSYLRHTCFCFRKCLRGQNAGSNPTAAGKAPRPAREPA